jgi:hypothetical protein
MKRFFRLAGERVWVAGHGGMVGQRFGAEAFRADRAEWR